MTKPKAKKLVIKRKGMGQRRLATKNASFSHGLRSNKFDIDDLDARTHYGRMARDLIKEFTLEGNHDTLEAALLIKQIVRKVLLLEQYHANAGEIKDLNVPPNYLQLNNAIRQDMARLSELEKPAPKMTLEDYLASKETDNGPNTVPE